MTAQRKRQLFWTVLTAGYLLFIFCNSLQTAQVSGQRSLGVVAHINRLLENWSIPLAVTDHLVRKSAHFAEYALYGLLLAVTLGQYTRRLWPHLFTIFFCGLAGALCDETIQLFVPGRSGQVSDVLLDFAGVLAGILLCLLCRTAYRRRDKKPNSTGHDT